MHYVHIFLTFSLHYFQIFTEIISNNNCVIIKLLIKSNIPVIIIITYKDSKINIRMR